MKRILCIMLALTMVFALAACGDKKPVVDSGTENEVIPETNGTSLPESGEAETEEDASAPADDDKPVEEENKQEEKKEEEKPAAAQKPTETQKPSASQKPAEAQKPAATEKPATPPPAAKPSAPAAPPASEKPAEPVTPPVSDPPAAEAPSAGDTVGDTLAAVWRANKDKSTEEIANAVISHSSIKFMGGVVPVSEGLLSGFGNTEIKGFKSAHMFAPGIGTIPFVGYVFELSDGTDADAFVNTLKSGADPRWNICTEAEQTVVEKSGNKVFFLMCPKSFEE